MATVDKFLDRTDVLNPIPRNARFDLCSKLWDNIPSKVIEYAEELTMHNWTFYVVTAKHICGKCYDRGIITISDKVILNATQSQKIWIISHELSHAFAGYEAKHGPEFMSWLKIICPKEHIHHELGYKPGNAMQAGIMPVWELPDLFPL